MMRPSFAGPVITIAIGLILWLALPPYLGPLNLDLSGMITAGIGVVYLLILLVSSAVPRRSSTARRTVDDPATGERVERSETDLP